MVAQALAADVKKIDDQISIVRIEGDLTSASEAILTEAYNQASADGVRVIVLDFSRLEYMNSSGIGLLVTLLVRANRRSQRLVAAGLNEHYREIFQLTRLDEAIDLYDDEQSALAAVSVR